MESLLAVYDSAVGAFGVPRFYRTKAEGIRAFADACEQDENLKRHGADYTLMELAEWEPETGKVVPHATPMSLGTAASFLKRAGPEVVKKIAKK